MIRAQTRFGRLTVGLQPFVVGTVCQLDVLRSICWEPGMCDIVEVRLDLLGADSRSWEEDVARLEKDGCPVIVTIRHADERGQWCGDDSNREILFDHALRVASAVDIEYRSRSLVRVSALAVRRQKALIVSYHDFEVTPPLNTLRGVIHIAPNYGTVVKIATLTRSEEDVAVLRELFRENCSASLCVLGMGPAAEQTRTEFPRLGSCFSYGYLDQPVAPGQPFAGMLMSLLRGHRR